MLESKNTPPAEEQATPPAKGEDPKPKTRHDQLGEISALLKGEDPAADPDGKPKGDDDQAGGKAPQGEDPQKEAKLETFDDVAKKLGVDVSDLYKLAIKQPGDGEDRVTIGELADLAKNKGQLELDRLEFDESKAKREADLMRAQQEINELVSLLPKRAISEDLLRTIGKKMQQTQERERGLTLTAIPEWKSEQAEADDRAAMRKHLATYGYSEKYLDQVQDHRTLKYIRDNMQRERNMTRALEAIKRKRTEGQRPGSQQGAGKKPTDGKPARQTVTQRRGEQVQAVAELLRST